MQFTTLLFFVMWIDCAALWSYGSFAVWFKIEFDTYDTFAEHNCDKCCDNVDVIFVSTLQMTSTRLF